MEKVRQKDVFFLKGIEMSKKINYYLDGIKTQFHLYHTTIIINNNEVSMKNITSFRHKLFLYIASSLAILLSLIGCFAFIMINNQLTEDTLNANQELATSTSINLNNLLEEMNRLALYASTNPAVRDTMSTLYYSDEAPNSFFMYSNPILEILTSITVPNSASDYRISILNGNNFFETTGFPTSTSYTNSFLYTEEYKEWYQNLPIIPYNKSIVFETYDPWTNTDSKSITMYREIFDSSTTTFKVGLVMIQFPSEDFIELIKFEDNNIESYIFDDEQTLLMSNATNADAMHLNTLSDTEIDNLLGMESGFTRGNAYSVVTLNNGWKLLVVQTQSMFISVILPIIIYLICGFLILIIISLLILNFIMIRATKPLQALIQQVNDVSMNNLSINTVSSTFDEFELLNNAFSDMFIRLRASMDENEKRKTYELQANLIALQSQMDPHFLYNILTVIKAMNHEQNYVQVDYCCNYLAKMLRYISSYDEKIATLNQELKHAELYLNLMKFRYENQFEFSINIESTVDTDEIHISKLVIQPLLENCFQHGFKNVLPVWNILINCYTLDDFWYITIADNGSGIASEKIKNIEELVAEFTENPSHSISHLTLGGMGLVNTLSRLKLNQEYNVDYSIGPNYPTGTIITMKGTL